MIKLRKISYRLTNFLPTSLADRHLILLNNTNLVCLNRKNINIGWATSNKNILGIMPPVDLLLDGESVPPPHSSMDLRYHHQSTHGYFGNLKIKLGYFADVLFSCLHLTHFFCKFLYILFR